MDKRIDALDALRAFAALGVILLHVAALNSVKLPPVYSAIVPYLGLGVEMFFTLSAFCLCLGYYGKLDDGAAAARFFKRRFLRIAPLFYALIPVWSVIMLMKFNQPVSAWSILLNVTFLFNLDPNSSGIVWAGWSIGAEMLFYLAFPLCACYLTSIKRAALAALVSVALSIAFRSYSEVALNHSFAQQNIIGVFPFFLAGIVAFHACRNLLKRPEATQKAIGHWLLIATFLWWGLLSYLGVVNVQIFGTQSYPYLFGIGFPLLIMSQVLAPIYAISNPLTVYLGVRGYSIYLLHPIAVLFTMPFVQTVIYSNGVKSPEAVPLLLSWLLVSLITIAGSIITYRWIEVPFYSLSRGKVLAPSTDSIPAVSMATPNS